MESKLGLCLSVQCSGWLLIEPVWNRNFSTAPYISCGTWLLIEPVWNRNISERNEALKGIFTFNRTSMESKPKKYSWCSCSTSTFNRTSMESKPEIAQSGEKRGQQLLIEPVWNRNCRVRLKRLGGASLLIEPVWNRNVNV